MEARSDYLSTCTTKEPTLSSASNEVSSVTGSLLGVCPNLEFAFW